MIVFPAIDIQNGRVVRLRQGVAGAGKEYFEDPVEAARKWCDEGALFLHVVDLDGAFAGEPKNRNIIRRICVILGSKAAEDQHFLVEAARQYASSLAVSLDARNDVVATHGWVDGSDKKVIPFALFLLSIGIRTLIYTDIRRDGMLTGPNLDMLEKLQQLPFIRLIASGGIGTIEDLKALRAMGLYGAVTGTALYEGRVTMAEIRALGGM